MKNSRIYILVAFIFCLGFVLIFRLFSVQVANHTFYKELAFNQHQTHQILFPARGEIFIKDRFYNQDSSSELFPLALNKEWSMAYAVPEKIKDVKETTELLAPLLEMDKQKLEQILSKKNDPYEPLKHKLSNEIAEQIKNLNIPGIKLTSEIWRYYPANDFASHVLGFVGFSENKREGQYGVEGYYEKELSGKTGFVEGEKDNQGRLIAIAKQYLQPAKDGGDLILTLDPNVQFFIEKQLNQVVDRYNAEGGTIIVLDPVTGATKGLANQPSFNPNEYSEVEDINVFLNPATHNIFEPGSIFKPFTVATALDKKLLTPQTTYTDKGYVVVGSHTIYNSDPKPQGTQTVTQILQKSLNTGTVFIQELIPKETFKEYLKKFGFSQKTGIDLKGETTGNISNLNTGRDIEFATASFGQGIAITPIELVTAMSAIANQGKMVTPHLVERIIYDNDKEKIIQPKIKGQIISPETAEQLVKMMVKVVDDGSGSNAKIPGYFIAGKTGTAQVPNSDQPGYSEKTIHSFGGFFPAFEPRFLVLVKLNNPQGVRFAAVSVAPVFKEIAEYILNYYEIPPSR